MTAESPKKEDVEAVLRALLVTNNATTEALLELVGALATSTAFAPGVGSPLMAKLKALVEANSAAYESIITFTKD